MQPQCEIHGIRLVNDNIAESGSRAAALHMMPSRDGVLGVNLAAVWRGHPRR
jgi:hypothetical protein